MDTSKYIKAEGNTSPAGALLICSINDGESGVYVLPDGTFLAFTSGFESVKLEHDYFFQLHEEMGCEVSLMPVIERNKRENTYYRNHWAYLSDDFEGDNCE